MASATPARRSSRGLGLSLVALGFAAGAAALTIGGWGEGAWGPRTVPLLAAATLALAGVAVALAPSTVEPPRAVEGVVAPSSSPKDEGEARVALLLGLAVLYVLAIDRVGYIAATALASPVVFRLFGARRPLTLVLAAIVLPLALHVAFFRLLGVFPPLGSWFDLLDHVPL